MRKDFNDSFRRFAHLGKNKSIPYRVFWEAIAEALEHQISHIMANYNLKYSYGARYIVNRNNIILKAIDKKLEKIVDKI